MDCESAVDRHSLPWGEPPFQFGFRSLLLLTTVCALAATIAGSMRGPIAFQVVVAFCLISPATYAVLRLPHACGRGLARLRRIRQRRSGLEAMVAAKRREFQQSKSVLDNKQQ